MPLLPAYEALIQTLGCNKSSDLPTKETIQNFRQAWRQFGKEEMAGKPAKIKFTDYKKQAYFKNPCEFRLYTPAPTYKNNMPLLLYFPGGGFIANDLGTNHVPCSHIAAQSGFQVITVHYKTAPEHPFPQGLRESYAMVDWLFEHAEKMELDPKKISIGGDSSGGNFAALGTHYAVNEKKYQVHRQILISPATDLSRHLQQFKTEYEDYDLLLSDALVERAYDLYVPETQERQSPKISPYYIETQKLGNLPPTLILCGEYDRLRSDTEAYAEKLKKAGVMVTKKIYSGQTHAFLTIRQALNAKGDIGENPVDKIAAYLKESKDTLF